MTTNTTAQRLKKKSTKIVEISDLNDPNEDPYVFEIRSLSTFELVESEELSENLPEEGMVLNEETMDKKKFSKLKQSVFPLMKKFIPMCTINPKIVFGDTDLAKLDENTLHESQLPMNVSSQLFEQILKLSGLDKESMENIKKKQQEAPSKT